MFAEENSRLISNLYNAKNRREVSDVLEYMGELGSCIFVYPILDGYKKYKHTSVGYYFIWNLSRLDYPNLGKRLNELLESYEIEKEHIPMALFFMAERHFFSDIANKMAAMYLDYCTDPEFRTDFNLNALDVGCVLDYMNKARILPDHEERLRELVFDENISDTEKAVILIHFFNGEQRTQHIDFFVENYFARVQNTALEKSIAKQLIFCTGRKAAGLKKMIMRNGSEEAGKILEKYGKWSSGRKAENAVVYDNLDAVIKIDILREQINGKTSRMQSGFNIFPDLELLPYQSQSVDDEDIFFGLCEDLRSVIVSVDPRVKGHGFDEKEAGEILNRVFEVGKDHSLADLFLFISSKKIAIDDNLYGLKELDKALEKLIARSEDAEFYENLRHMGIEDMYRDGQWHRIHSFFLNSYIQVLENMNKCFNQLVNEDLD